MTVARLTMASKKMPDELQKLKWAMCEIDRTRASTRTRYSTVVEDPYKSGYIPSRVARKRGSPKRTPAVLDKVDATMRVKK